MIPLYLFLVSIYRRIREGLKDPEFRGVFYGVLILLALGTLFYHSVEGWSWLDSFYFTVITLTTVGYGDFSPATVPGKVFTILYILIGLGIISSFIVMLAEQGIKTGPLRAGSTGKKQEEGEEEDNEAKG